MAVSEKAAKLHERGLRLSLNMSPIRDALAELTPHMELSQRGRMRLLSRLQIKFGTNFRAHPLAHAAIESFDNDLQFAQERLNLEDV